MATAPGGDQAVRGVGRMSPRPRACVEELVSLWTGRATQKSGRLMEEPTPCEAGAKLRHGGHRCAGQMARWKPSRFRVEVFLRCDLIDIGKLQRPII